MVLSVSNSPIAMSINRNIYNANKTMAKSMEKLSSGYRINTASDAPADLIISEKLRSQINGLEKAIENATTTGNVMAIADGALGEVQGILRSMKKLALHAANSGVTSKDQIAADQAQLDAALMAIDRIMGTTSYAGQKLLNNINIGGGNGTSFSPSNGDAANVVATPEMYARNKLDELWSRSGSSGELSLIGADAGAQVDENGNLLADKSFVVTGTDENASTLAQFDFSEGESLSDVVARLKSYQIPDSELPEEDPDTPYTPPSGRIGDDVDTVALDVRSLAKIQGMSDEEAAEYLSSYMRNFIDSDNMIELEAEMIPLSERDQAIFDLSQTLQNMHSSNLGGIELTKVFEPGGNMETRILSLMDMMSGGAADLFNDPDAAMQIIDQAIKDTAAARAQIGAMQKYGIDSNINAMQTEIENLTKSESYIRDTDMALEMVEYTRAQIVSQMGVSLLSKANAHHKNIINLLV